MSLSSNSFSEGGSRPITWCCEVLRKLLGEMPRGSVILIAGYPGAGKTTLAAKTAYENLELGHKVLYIGLNETKDKFIKYLTTLGMDFSKFIKEGKFRFVEIPLLSPEVGLDVVLDSIAKEVGTFKPDLVVVDSITPLIKMVSKGSDYEARAFMRSGLYKVFTEMKSVLMLIADVPLGSKLTTLGNLEFVADYLILIRFRLARTSIRRCIEVLKARGVPIRLPRIYFKIVKGKGPIPYVPRELVAEEARTALRAKVSKFMEIKRRLGALKQFVSGLGPGSQLLILYPPGSDANRAFTVAQVAMSTRFGFNTAVITYSMDPLDLFKLSLATLLSSKVVTSIEEGVKLLERHVKFLGLNLSIIDTDLLPYCEVSDTYIKPERDIVVVPDMKALYDYLGDASKFNRIQYTFANWDRTLGTISIRYFPDLPEVKDLVLSEVSDIIIKLVPSTTTPRTILHYRMLLTKSYLSTVKEVPVSKIVETLKSVANLELPTNKVLANALELVDEWLSTRSYEPRCVLRN